MSWQLFGTAWIRSYHCGRISRGDWGTTRNILLLTERKRRKPPPNEGRPLKCETALELIAIKFISSSDCRAHNRRVLRSYQLIALHHCRHPRSHLRGSPRWSHAEPRLHRPPAPSSPRSPAPLDSSPAREVPLWFLSFSPKPWHSPPSPGSRL